MVFRFPNHAARFDDVQSSDFELELQLVTLADELHRVETAAMMAWRQDASEARRGGARECFSTPIV